MTDLTCPTCGNENTQKLSIIRELGRGSAGTVALGASSRGLALGAAHTESSSAMADKVKPPLSVLMHDLEMAAALGMTLGLGGCVAWVHYVDDPDPALNWPFWLWAIVPGVLVLLQLLALPNAIRRQREWHQSYMCLRCGETFIGPDPA